MNFSHYTDVAASLAADLVNDLDTEAKLSDVQHFLEVRGVHDLGRLTRADVEEVGRLRAELRAVFVAEDAEVARGLNRLISEAKARPELTNHDGAWHLHFAPPGATVGSRLAATAAMGLATVVAEDGTRRLKCCAAPGCDRVFVDLSRNLSRRYCSDRCSNRENVAAFRARQRGT
ncbi:MAG: hypothetical protein QOG64_337 [Acidimicrobiaceae bacterium]|nr:hypothetical protein [Acidimicrobiaceae bacterium]